MFNSRISPAQLFALLTAGATIAICIKNGPGKIVESIKMIAKNIVRHSLLLPIVGTLTTVYICLTDAQIRDTIENTRRTLIDLYHNDRAQFERTALLYAPTNGTVSASDIGAALEELAQEMQNVDHTSTLDLTSEGPALEENII